MCLREIRFCKQVTAVGESMGDIVLQIKCKWKQIYLTLSDIVMLCAIWYHLYNFKNVKNTHGRVLLLVKLQASVFTKLYKWYQIVQRTTNVN